MACSSFSIAPVTAGAVTSLPLMTTLSDEVSLGNAALRWLNFCTTVSSCGSVSIAGVPVCMCSAGAASASSSATEVDRPQQRAAHDAVHDARPEAERGHARLQAVEAGNAALVDAVAA